jgi:hypothetical protein
MKLTFLFSGAILLLVSIQSCTKSTTAPGVIIDPYTYAVRYDWREDSVQTGSGSWAKIENGRTFSWLSQNIDIQKSNFATYSNRANIKTNFMYVIQKDSVFAINLSSDTVCFFGAGNKQRADLTGRLTLSPDTLLTLHNTGVVPAVSLKYKLVKIAK